MNRWLSVIGLCSALLSLTLWAYSFGFDDGADTALCALAVQIDPPGTAQDQPYCHRALKSWRVTALSYIRAGGR